MVTLKSAPLQKTGVLGKRILLLEDDPDFKGILTDVLEQNDYTVVAVQNGAEGVREVMKADFDAIICDMMMPGLPGDMFYLAVERMRPALCSTVSVRLATNCSTWARFPCPTCCPMVNSSSN